MRRPLNVLSLLAGLAVLAATAARADDRITYIDRFKSEKEKKTVTATVTGTISDETTSRVLLKASVNSIPAVDVVDIYYKVPSALAKTYREADNAELTASRPDVKPADRKKALQAALDGYRKLLADKSLKAYKFVQRHLQYKVARLTARLAADDQAKRKEATDLLLKFKSDHPNGWQMFGCLEQLAALQEEAGDFKGAAQAFDDMAKMKDLTPEARRKYQLAAAQALVQAGDASGAEGRLDEVLKSIKKDDPQYFRLQMTRARCQASQKDQVDKAIATLNKVVADLKETDVLNKAIALNTLGDCCMMGNRPKDALYAYLNVDLYYSGDRDEHRKACVQLAKLFDMLGEKDRAKEYQEKSEQLKN